MHMAMPVRRSTLHLACLQPWDGLKGYAMVYGVTRMTGTTLANFYGATGCGGTFQTHALGNHQKEPEAFHPVFMRKTNIWNVAV
jgi:hypothetical protein